MPSFKLLKMKIKSVALSLWDTDDCSLQRRSLEKENISTSVVGPANNPPMAASPTIPEVCGLKWNKNEGSLHHQGHMFPTAFYYLGL